VAERVSRGEIWLYEYSASNKKRPVLILSRQEVIGLLHTVIHDSAVNLDHPQTVDQRKLRRYIGSLGSRKMQEVCKALAIATGCDT